MPSRRRDMWPSRSPDKQSASPRPRHLSSTTVQLWGCASHQLLGASQKIDVKLKKMRAMVYAAGPAVVAETMVQVPRPGKKEVLVKIMAAGVNPVDAKHVFGDKVPERLGGLVRRSVKGQIPGFDLSGVVESDGGGFKKGDEVYGIAPPSVPKSSFNVDPSLDFIYYFRTVCVGVRS